MAQNQCCALRHPAEQDKTTVMPAVLLVVAWLSVLAVIVVCSIGNAPNDAVLVFEKEESGYFCLKIPYLYRTSKGTLIAMSEARGKDGRNSCDDWSGTDLVYKRSFDNGQTWSPMGTVWSNSTAEETNVVGNAGIVQDSATGRIWVPLCRNNEEVFITYSDDDGETWSEPVYHPELVLDDWKWVGLGPPAGLQLSTGRMLVPSYHTSLYKGDGEVSKGHTVYSDDSGATWHIGSAEFGAPYLSNECQAVELQNGSVLINARTLLTHRIQVMSHDGGLTFGPPVRMATLVEPLEGCEGSTVREPASNMLYYSGTP
jgi:sialidase-1